MTTFLRIISKYKWLQHPNGVPWLPPGEFNGDTMSDLKTENGTFSVWEIDSTRSNLVSIVTAVAAIRDRVGKIDYALLNPVDVDALGIRVERTPSKMPDVTVESYHRDLMDVTVTVLGKLHSLIAAAPKDRVPPRQVKSQLIDAVKTGRIDRAALKPDLLKDLSL